MINNYVLVNGKSLKSIKRKINEVYLLTTQNTEVLMALAESVQALQTAVSDVAARVSELTGPLQQQVADLTAAVATEREKFDALVVAEDAEDVQQNADLAAARAATDQLLADAGSAATQIDVAVGDLNNIAPRPVQ